MSSKQNQIVNAEVVVRPEDIERASRLPPLEYREEQVEVPRSLTRVAFGIFASLLFLMPLCFGAVHPKTALVSEFLVFSAVAALLIFGRAAVRNAFSSDHDRSSSRLTLFCLGALLLYACAQSVLLFFNPVAHPILGYASIAPNMQQTLGALRQMLFFLCTFVLARALFSTSAAAAHRTTNICIVVGILAALVALAHWFSDNGMLFWTFEPEYRYVSERARWPFVNPNHLGNFLLPVFFLVIARVLESVTSLQRLRESKGAGRDKFLSLILSSRTFQRGVLRIAFLLIAVMIILIAIIGTQSRGSWLGLSLGALFSIGGFLLWRVARRGKERKLSPTFALHPAQVHSNHHRRNQDSKQLTLDQIRELLPKLVLPVAIVCALLMFFFFLNQRGAELLAGRIDYGLMYSKDDTRWQFYSDSLPILREHLFFGVGLGAWASAYPVYMSPMLAGVTPVYLHSDPYQLIIELGIVGILPLLLLVTVIFGRCLARIRTVGSEDALRILGLASGIVAFFAASCLDFPFHIPAILFLVATHLALTVFYVDRQDVSP